MQLAACIPNFTIQEYPTGEDEPPKSEIMTSRLEYDGRGSLIVPTLPGIGVELATDAAERYPYKMRWLGTRLYDDGSVMDQ